jgi:hypothetical protein
MRKTLGIIPALFLLAAIGVPAAQADTVTQWTLSGITFTGGYSATGSFDYDANTETVSNVDVTFNGFTTTVFDAADSIGSALPGYQVSFASGVLLVLTFVEPLTTLPVPATDPINPALTFSVSSPYTTGPTGSIVSSPVAVLEPGSLDLMLLSAGLLGLMTAMRMGIEKGLPKAS